MKLTVATYQGRHLYNEIKESIQVITKIVRWAENKEVDILCFPECFLQGYTLDEEQAREVSVDLRLMNFNFLETNKVTVILGLIEREKRDIYNTAVVIENGKLVGKYRKHFLHSKEAFYSGGKEFPIYIKKGVKYGINICYDSRFDESVNALVEQGAELILCPLNNSLPHSKAKKWKEKHLLYLKNKAKQSGCWIVSADIVEQTKLRTGFGCTCLINPEGVVVEYLEQLKTGRLLKRIEFD
jgi:predicted amidohydrolase